MKCNKPIIMEESISLKIADAIKEVYCRNLLAQRNTNERIYMCVTPKETQVDVEAVMNKCEDEIVQESTTVIFSNEEELAAYQTSRDYILWFASQLLEKDSFLGWTEKKGGNVVWVLGKLTLGEPK